jgi:hypothetical protein
MSGGHFEYNQYRISDIEMQIEELIKSNDDQSLNEWGDKRGREYSPEIIEKFKEAVIVLKKARNMAQRIDWLVSGDDGPESFLRRWKEEVGD